MPNIPIFIISLPKDTKRRQPLLNQLDQLGLNAQLFLGVNGATLSDEYLKECYDEAKALRLLAYPLTRGEIGCALSHLGVYRKIVEDGLNSALVLEDDVCIVDENLPEILQELDRIYSTPQPVVVLLHLLRYLGNTGQKLDIQATSNRKIPGYCIYDAYRGLYAFGYFINRAAAQSLLTNLYPVYAAADRWRHFGKQFTAVKLLVPYIVGLWPDNVSRIDAIDGGKIRLHRRWTFAFTLRYLAEKVTFALFKRPFLNIKTQPRDR